jgi:hypothetical protein
MSSHRAAVLALVAALVAPPSFAQDLDVPMPSVGKTKSKAGKRRTSAKKGASKKPVAAEDDLDVPLPSSKPSTAKKPAPVGDDLDVPLPSPSSKPATAKKPVPSVDDDLIPTVGKAELVVKLSGGIKGARLLVDNKDVGALPLSGPLQVDTGEHTVVVRRPGYADFSRRVTIQQGKPAEVSVALEAVAGVVTVTADVAGAKASINGQDKGPLPINGLVLKPGSYEIVVSKEGYQPETKNLGVRAGKDYTVAVNLRPSATPPTVVAGTDAPTNPVLTPPPPAVATGPQIPLKEEPEVSTSQPWFKRWYVWAGVGVVAAAAAGAVVATQGGATTPLTADRVCGGPCDGTINGIRAGAR